MILSDAAILNAIRRGEIVIDPFDPHNLGGNSYDVHLSPHFKTYAPALQTATILGGPEATFPMLDAAVDNPWVECEVGHQGAVLVPGVVYLASTVEYTETHRHVPYLDGRSSVGRLGINIHATAGRGDVGFCNHWTMEITVAQAVRVYPGMRIGQLTYHAVEGEVLSTYARKVSTTYGRAPRDPKPVSSGMWRSLNRSKP